MTNTLVDKRYQDIKSALDRAIDNYIQSRREKIPLFVQNNFSVRGAARLNRKAFGYDIVKAPANFAWAPPYILIKIVSAGLGKIGFKKIHKLTKNLPSGFTSAVQREVNRLITTELLESPTDEKEQHVPDALLIEILNQPEIQNLFQEHLVKISIQSKKEGFREELEKRLREYASSRISVSEITNNIITLASGAGMFGKMTPGGVGLGSALSSAIAQQSAISGCILGPGAGAIYYGWFPASPSVGLVVSSTVSVLAVLVVFSAFSGMITDPLQAKLGFHEKRLNQLVDSLESTLSERGDIGLKLRENFVARILDFSDYLKTAAGINL